MGTVHRTWVQFPPPPPWIRPVAYYFYVLRSKKDGGLYKGTAQDVERRLVQHNVGKTKSLRHRIPFEVIHSEEYATRAEALARERWSKTLPGGKELHTLLSDVGSPARAGKPGTG